MHSPLHKPFPYRATAKLQRDLKSKFTEDDCINADFNHYWMHTAAYFKFCTKWKRTEHYVSTNKVVKKIVFRVVSAISFSRNRNCELSHFV